MFLSDTTTHPLKWDEAQRVLRESLESPLEIDKIIYYQTLLMYATGIYAGFRISDYLSWTWREYRFGEVIADEGKTDKSRKVLLHPRLVDISKICATELPDHLTRTEQFAYVNPSTRAPITVDTANDRLRKFLMAYGVNHETSVSSHMLRKTWCRRTLDYIADQCGNFDTALYIVQKMMNHASKEQTLDYTGYTREYALDAYVKI